MKHLFLAILLLLSLSTQSQTTMRLHQNDGTIMQIPLASVDSITYYNGNPGNLATLTTNAPGNITTGSASSGGNITADGGSPVTHRGICWATTQNPTTANSVLLIGGGTGSFSANITGLNPNTIYYVRAFAINTAGTSYGIQVSFKTLNNVVEDSIVNIGTQTWMTKNLNVVTYRNGDTIPQVDYTQMSSLRTGAWCYMNNDPANGALYGKLYNWYAVNDPRGLAPAGWHIPTDGEWTILVSFLGGDSVAGGKMKAVSPLWQAPNIGATNSSGFSALPGGNTRGNTSVGKNTVFWSSSLIRPYGSFSASYAWTRLLNSGFSIVRRYDYDISDGFSVRCIKNTGSKIGDSAWLSDPKIIDVPNANGATCEGNIIFNGGSQITQRGFCWSTSPNPTTTNTVALAGTGGGSFTINITGMNPKTTYYVRAFAVNDIGTNYSNQLSFTTSDTGRYQSIAIGTQVWMTKNLDVVTYRNGDTIPQVTDPIQWSNLRTGAWCYDYNDPAKGGSYGKLYNWYAVNDPRGLAPAGWHVAKNDEWASLVTYLGGDSVAKNKLVAGSSNSCGFYALVGGRRLHDGDFDFNPYDLSWWTSSEFDSVAAIIRYSVSYNSIITTEVLYKTSGFTVRCVKD